MTENNNIILEKIHIHKTSDGTRIPIHMLKTDHLKNIINLAKKHIDNVDKDSLNIYLNELDVRSIHPNELIMDQSNRVKSIKLTRFNCTKDDCTGVINEYETRSETQVFCDTCWVQHGPIEWVTLYSGILLSEIIELWELPPIPRDWLDDPWDSDEKDY